jgi:colanic acid biosynthesis glycosyl transferase WcaI
MRREISRMTKSPVDLSVIPNYRINDHLDVELQYSRKDLNLPEGKFLVIYTGAMGKKQGLDNLVGAARELLNREEIEFYVYGHGSEEEALKVMSADLPNFHIRPTVDLKYYSSLLRAADCLVLTEQSGQLSMALPSKLTNYFASGIPIVAAVPEAGATAELIRGRSFLATAENPRALASAIMANQENQELRKEYAQAAYNYYEKNLSREAGHSRYSQWFFL